MDLGLGNSAIGRPFLEFSNDAVHDVMGQYMLIVDNQSRSFCPSFSRELIGADRPGGTWRSVPLAGSGAPAALTTIGPK